MQQLENLDELRLEELSLIAKDWCLVNGISKDNFYYIFQIYFKIFFKGLVFLEKNNELMANKTQNHDSALPLPVTLFPTQYPDKEFLFATSIQNHFNELIYTISNDYEFLRDTLEK